MPAPSGLVTAALRSAAADALAVLVRRIGDFDDAEDALQDALLEASRAWIRDGIPSNPAAWLVAAGRRRWIDAVRTDVARRRREDDFARASTQSGSAPAEDDAAEDDTLDLYLLCCHPALPATSRVALTLRSIGGLSTREIARGLLLTDSAVAQRIVRAKAILRTLDGPVFRRPPDDELAARVGSVLDVLAVIHTESHSALDGDEIARPGLGAEALRVARQLVARVPEEAAWRGEVMGLIALMLLTDARQPARLDTTDRLVPLAEQDRSLWRRDLIDEGIRTVTAALGRYPLGRYQLRAAIAAVHAEAEHAEATDWRQIVALYDLLAVLEPGPISALGRLVALGAGDPSAALDAVERDPVARSHPRAPAVRAHLLARCGRAEESRAAYREAAARATNSAERRFLADRASAAPPSGS